MPLHKIWNCNIGAYQLDGTLHYLYLVAKTDNTFDSHFLYCTNSEKICLMFKRWEERRHRKDLSFLQQIDCKEEVESMYFLHRNEDIWHISSNSSSFDYDSALLSPTFQFSALTFPNPHFFVLYASFTSVIPRSVISFQLPLFLVSFCLFSARSCSLLSSLPSALFSSTLEASLVKVSSNKLYIWQDVGKVSSSVCLLLASTYGFMLQHQHPLPWNGFSHSYLLSCPVSCCMAEDILIFISCLEKLCSPRTPHNNQTSSSVFTQSVHFNKCAFTLHCGGLRTVQCAAGED